MKQAAFRNVFGQDVLCRVLGPDDRYQVGDLVAQVMRTGYQAMDPYHAWQSGPVMPGTHAWRPLDPYDPTSSPGSYEPVDRRQVQAIEDSIDWTGFEGRRGHGPALIGAHNGTHRCSDPVKAETLMAKSYSWRPVYSFHRWNEAPDYALPEQVAALPEWDG